MLNPKLSNLAATAEVDALSALLDGGTFELYDGAQPADCDTPVSTQQLLVSCSFGTPAFDPGVAGAANMAAPAVGIGAITGSATWYRMRTSGGAAVHDGTVGTSNANLNLTSTLILAGATLSIDSFVLTARKG